MKVVQAICRFFVDSPLLVGLSLAALAVVALVAGLGAQVAAGGLLFVLVVVALAVDLGRAVRPK